MVRYSHRLTFVQIQLFLDILIALDQSFPFLRYLNPSFLLGYLFRPQFLLADSTRMSFDISALQPQIRDILSAPGTDLTTISAKSVKFPGFGDEQYGEPRMDR